MLIRKAERKQAKLRLGISGASGSGKTWSALEIATGMGGKIGMIDTEAGRGELYGSDFNYDIIRLETPYSPERYIEAIKCFEQSGYDILIIDSLSHAWVGEGGVLSIVDKAGSNSFTSGWKIATPKQNALVDALVTSKMHIITTLRVKTEYVVEKNDRGKAEPRKVGLSPVQRDGLEYEFTLFMDINQEHIAHVTKDNTKLFDQEYLKPSKEMGKKLSTWISQGKSANDMEVEDLNAVKAMFEGTGTTQELQVVFYQALKLYPPLSEKIIALKDERKMDIMQIHLESMPSPVPAYEQELERTA